MAKKESSQQASEQQEGKVDRIDNALQKFSDMLIARMEQMKESKWKKGWTDGRTAQFGLPQNLVSTNCSMVLNFNVVKPNWRAISSTIF